MVRSPPRWIPHSATSCLALILLSATHLNAQSISNTPVPPLQWINLSSLLSGSSAAPPLKDASIGYDSTTRNLVIFGGESSQGFPQSDTYILDLDSLTWRAPNTLPQLSGIRPPARSAAVSGEDTSANYRRSHIVIGGRGTDGTALSDVWEFDYANEFWSQVQVTNPQLPARWSAAGGRDPRAPTIPDVTLAAPNTSYFIAGGYDGKSAIPLSDVWRLNVTGALSPNNANNVVASWQQISISNVASTAAPVGLAGAVVYQGTQQHIAAVGGCMGTGLVNASCAQGNSFLINVDTTSGTSPAPCPAPRVGAALAPNMNLASGSFQSQVFLLLGTYNSSLWDDGNGLNQGEVAVLDVTTGAWARVLPAGDPGTTGKQAFPSPREGAAIFSAGEALVGSSRTVATDIIVFGGKDADGNYLSETWLLRAYNSIISQSGQHWSGFGDGKLTTGTNASGAGVTIQFMTKCASALAPLPTSSGSSSSSGSTGSPTSTNGPGQPNPTNTQGPSHNTVTNLYDTSTTHKALAAVSVALVLPAIVLYRLSLPPVSSTGSNEDHSIGFFYLCGIFAVTAFALGVVGLATAFTSFKYTAAALAKRASASPPNLATAHGRAGLALFVVLYAIVPALIALIMFLSRHDDSGSREGRTRKTSNDIAEKQGLYHDRGASPASQPATEPADATATPASPRVRSWASVSLGRFSLGHGRHSSDSAVERASSPSARSFEVTNRPTRARHVSANSLAAITDPRPTHIPRNLSSMSWLDRRRSVGATGDLDYALTQLNHHPQCPPTPGTAVLDMQSTRGLMNSTLPTHPLMPGLLESFTHILLHAALLALCALALAALWSRAPRATFAVFLAWTVLFYILIVGLAWNGIPRESILTVVLYRLRSNPGSASPGQLGTATPHPPSSVGLDAIPFPSDGHGGIYQHQPPYRTAHDSEYPTSLSHAGHTTLDDDADDDEDDETRQRRIEEEMSRRDVSIVTVPKRKLYLTNPEPS